MLEDDDYRFLEKYLDATKANLFFARSVIVVEGPGEALLLPTLSKLLGKDFTDYGVSLVDVRSTGLRRYARIFQRSDERDQLQVRVGCVTDRDIMPNCAPRICIDEDKYTDDKKTWPIEAKRNWRAEADFADGDAAKRVDEICKKADGQQVKTYVAGHWTLEYDLAYIGLKQQKMFDILIGALVKVSYVSENRTTRAQEIKQAIEKYSSDEEKASYFYSFFMKKTTSKAEFAQQLAFDLEVAFKDAPTELETMLPSYLVDAIKYVTKG